MSKVNGVYRVKEDKKKTNKKFWLGYKTSLVFPIAFILFLD